MAEEHSGGQHEQQVSAERRARQKLLFAVPIIPIVMFIVAPCALFLFTADLALPRIRIEYAPRDGDRDAPASALATAVAVVPSEEQQQLPPRRQQTNRMCSLGPKFPITEPRIATWLVVHPGLARPGAWSPIRHLASTRTQRATTCSSVSSRTRRL